jgi:probable phosphoglycerate mutase
VAVIRHGEAYCNVENFIGGHAGCRGLTERGVRQAERLAQRLAETTELSGAAALVTSNLPRAYQTAEILAPVLAAKESFRTCSVCERHPGEADGLTWAEFARRYERRSLPGEGPELPLSPGGETWVEFLDRAAGALVALAEAYPSGLAVVVAHGGIIDSSMIRFLGLPDHGASVRLHPEHSSITEWQHTGERWRLVRYNDAAHLLGHPEADLITEPPDWVRTDLVEIEGDERLGEPQQV